MMASNHVPSEQPPVQGHNLYNDPAYQNLFSSTDRYGTPSWETQLHHQSSAPQNWHHGVYAQQPFNAAGQAYAAQPHGLRTASPYQYGQFGQPGAVPNYGQVSNVDPSLGMDPNAVRQQQQSPYPMPMRNITPQGHAGTVTPQALQHNVTSQLQRPPVSPFQAPSTVVNQYMPQRTVSQSFVQPVKAPEYELPGVSRKGGFFSRDQSEMAKITNSNPLNKFVLLGNDFFHLPAHRTALPVHNARLSIKDLKKAGKDSRKLKAQLHASKSQMRALKSQKRSAASPADLKREATDSASSDETSDDSSDYTSDEEEEESPLPASRPDDPHAAVRYDIIKSTWYPRSSSPSPDKIKTSMREIWEVLNTIQKRWRADTRAVTEAEEQKKTGELPVLKSRVASQRDLLQSALAAALEFAHPDVLYHLGQIKPFLYLCYQFLANRFHSKDYDGKLSAVIFEVLSLCGTLTSELLEETKVIKALTSLKKHTNDKNKALIQKITESAAANSKKAKVGSPATADQAEPKSVKRSAPETASRPASDVPLLKKPRPTEGALNGVKKDAVGAVGAKTAAPATQKRPGEKPVAASAPVKTRVTQVNNKPSGLFARLTAASIQKPTTPPVGSTKSNGQVRPAATSVAAKDKKPAPQTTSKPAFSFAQTMASLLKPEKTETVPVKSEKQLPNETPEEKAKRERKESRRHLRVKFRADASLVEIRYFEHEAQEDMGHEAHLKRDAGDLGGEGRMFKQHKELDVDDDEDDEDEKTWSEPSQVDFSRIDPGERSRNYFPYGGGEMQPDSPEKEANIRRENATLMVIYADASDIPTSPREPLEDATPAAPAIHFGTPSSEVLQRCPVVQQPAPVMDFSNLENIMKQFANTSNQGNPATAPPAPVQAPFVPPTASNAPVDIASLLSALQQSSSQNLQPASAPAPAPPMPLPAPPALDFNAILAGLQASGAALPPPPPGAPPFPFPFPGLPQAPDNAAWQSQMQPHMQPQMQPAQDRDLNGNNKRQRDDGNGGNFDRGLGKRPKFRGNQDNKPHKVLACRFWHKGTCMKGDDCTYIHDNNM